MEEMGVPLDAAKGKKVHYQTSEQNTVVRCANASGQSICLSLHFLANK